MSKLVTKAQRLDRHPQARGGRPRAVEHGLLLVGIAAVVAIAAAALGMRVVGLYDVPF